MAAGLAIFGLAGYVFVAVTGRATPGSQANLAIAFYFLVNVVGPGVFYALEQVTSRATSSAVASNRPLGPALRRCGTAGAGLVVVVVAALLLLAPVLLGATLHHDWRLYAEVLATPVIMAGLHLVRGVLGGQQRFGRYAATLAIEGAVRLGLCLALAAAGATQAWIYGVGYLAASVVAVAAGLVRPDDRALPKPDSAPHPGVGASLAALAVATLAAQLLPNLAPLVVTSRLAADSAVALAFGQAAVIARIPLLLFFPVQTMLLPSLSRSAARGELAVVGRIVRLTLTAVAAVGTAGAAIFVVSGGWALRTFLGTTTELTMAVMLLLGISTVVLIAAYAVQPALVALHRDRVVTAGWALGCAATLGLALLPADPPAAAAAAQLIGPALTLLVLLLALRAALRAAPAWQEATRP